VIALLVRFAMREYWWWSLLTSYIRLAAQSGAAVPF